MTASPLLKQVLFVSASEALRQFGDRVLRSAGLAVTSAPSAAAARESLAARRADLVVVDLADAPQEASGAMVDLLGQLREESPSPQGPRLLALVRVRSADHFRALFSKRRITNFLAVGEDETLEPRELAVTAQKLVSRQLFGLSRYLGGSPRLETMELDRSEQKDAVVDRAEAFAVEAGCHPRVAQQIAIAVDELVTNALYNAPVDVKGAALYAHLPRSTPVKLDQRIVIQLASDPHRVAISALDPFGSLLPDIVMDYLSRCFAERSPLMSPQRGGAGLGLYYLFNLLHSFIIDLEPGHATESIGLLDISKSYRAYAARGRSFNLFVGPP
ncbi:MAG: hypothetical protein IPJ65_21090 [Archangiaceae bacterium]|nr:hypothetical protein [Archangiaceae bacterium]